MTKDTTIGGESLAAETMGKQLLLALVDELKVLQDPWAKTSQKKQDDALDRLRARIEHLTREAITILAQGGQQCVKAEVESVTFKDGIKAVLTFPKGLEGVHDLADQVGDHVFVVITSNPDEFLQGMGDVQGEPDQRALLEDEAA